MHMDASVCVRCPHSTCHPKGARGQQHLSSNGHASCPPPSAGRDTAGAGKRIGSQLEGVSTGHTNTKYIAGL